MGKDRPKKQRSQYCYDRKVTRVKKWYNHLLREREKEVINPNNKLPTKRKELKSLEYYLDKITKPNLRG